MNKFDEDYFERGQEKGISLYSQNGEGYFWKPERSFREAHRFIDHMDAFEDVTVFDFGCAKGFFVNACRLLGYEAYGFDISEYAIKNCHPSAKDYVSTDLLNIYDLISYDMVVVGLCKDVLEHCESKKDLLKTLRRMKIITDQYLIIVPLGDGKKYNVPVYEKDITHHLKYDKEKWIKVIENVFEIKWVSNKAKGIKDNWEEGNLFIRTVGK